jgi:hypothetical protein
MNCTIMDIPALAAGPALGKSLPELTRARGAGRVKPRMNAEFIFQRLKNNDNLLSNLRSIT